ncbi:Rv3235 family protein [Cellulomonas sp.]|uniref:Rv3235 family protein n=1 Tax=Cellulomonas sp. TaxID=40001 RepID=UPI003BAB62EA
MSALVLTRDGTAAEDAFARVRDAATEPGSGPADTRPWHPRARLVPAPVPPLIEDAPGRAHSVPLAATARIAVLRARDRSFVAEADDEPGPAPEGDPTVVARAIALAALEVLAGGRSVAQLARWLTPGVYETLQVRAGLTQRVLGTDRVVRPPSIRRARSCRVGAHAMEATIVADHGSRVRAVALRLEGHRGSWRVTALEIG